MFDLTKPVQTRDGRKARIICTDLNHYRYGLVGLGVIESPQTTHIRGTERTLYFNLSTGKEAGREDTSPYDLVNTPVRTETWQNVYQNPYHGSFNTYRTKEKADEVWSEYTGKAGYIVRHYEDKKFVRAEFVPLEGV